MVRTLMITGMIAALATVNLVADEKETKTKDIEVRDLTLTVPESWKSEQPTSSMRLGQISVPAVEGDEENGELLIFSFAGGGGSKTDNIKRWIGQFDADGRESNTVEGVSEQGDYHFVNISGTYNKSVGPPILRKTKAVKNARMLGVILNVEGKGVYYLKLTGPDKTIKESLAAFKKSFGANVESEKKVELE